MAGVSSIRSAVAYGLKMFFIPSFECAACLPNVLFWAI
jgi:hypothetical protein